MKKQGYLLKLGSLVLQTALFFLSAVQAIAQYKDYKPGEKIEYKVSSSPDVWEQGVFVRGSTAGSYATIRLKPTAAFKDGYERGAEWSQIRPIGPRATIVPDERRPRNAEDNKQPVAVGAGLMTQDEIIGFLQDNLGPRQFENPRRDEIKQELVEMIKQRGLAFRHSVSLTEFRSRLSKVGTSSEISFALLDNYGEPTKQTWLMGAWNLGKIGGAVIYERNNRVYRQGESAVANVGTLTLNSNGTYGWESVSAQSTNGRWRKATKAEMKSEGGDGLVLLGAKSGYDWLVTKDRRTPLPGEWLFVAELGTRQIKESAHANLMKSALHHLTAHPAVRSHGAGRVRVALSARRPAARHLRKSSACSSRLGDVLRRGPENFPH